MAHKGKNIAASLVLIISLGLVLAWSLSRQGFFASAPEPLAIAQAAIKNTFAYPSYTFKTRSVLYLDDEERVFSVLEGEKTAQGRHVWGSILGTGVNVYHINGNFYLQDALSGKWNLVGNTDLKAAATLIEELNPEKNFYFADWGTAEDFGKGEIDGKKAQHICLKPVLEDKWIEQYFKDITFDLYIINALKEPKLLYTQISGVSKENTGAKLVIENYFAGYGKKIIINEPQLPPPEGERVQP